VIITICITTSISIDKDTSINIGINITIRKNGCVHSFEPLPMLMLNVVTFGSHHYAFDFGFLIKLVKFTDKKVVRLAQTEFGVKVH